MIKIQSLLNPLSEASLGRHSPPPSPHLSDIHRQKVSKTAAVFVKGEPKGEVRYPPHEVDDYDDLAAELLKYRITPTPLRDIKKYPRHIPYNSDKKSFLTKTGREAFEVFQYTYKVPGDSTEYVVMWDYNIGLTRITPFFKSCKYPKTTPAKALRINSGLGAISYSITGGALAAQGYWMPFEAAKAVAATFCYPIRHALTPIFGRDFVDMCMLPSEASYASFKIRDDIVRSSTQQTEQWR
ncbi:transcription regulator HTH, apses-type DNA-binding domain-containing protein, partial [Phyllosticta citrichinensis]